MLHTCQYEYMEVQSCTCMHNPIYHKCMGPGSKDLDLTTALACTVGWSGVAVYSESYAVSRCAACFPLLAGL